MLHGLLGTYIHLVRPQYAPECLETSFNLPSAITLVDDVY